LECFFEDGETDICLNKTSIEKENLSICIAETDENYNISYNYNNKSSWKGNFPSFDINKNDNELYGVSGSPTLVINDQKITTSRSSAALLKTICSSFESMPEECETDLSTVTPSAGFGTGSGNNSNASCN